MNRIRRAVKRLLLMITLMVLFGVSACSGESTPTLSMTPTSNVTTYPPAIDQINVNINEAAGTSGGFNVSIYVDVNELAYSKPANVIYYYDMYPPTEAGEPAYSSPGTYIVEQGLDQSATWKNVPPGYHTFYAQVVNADDTPFDTPVIAQATIDIPDTGSEMPQFREVNVEMELPRPESPQVMEPQPLPPIEGQVTCSVHNFKINDDAIGKQNVSGEGHYIYYLDTIPPILSGQSAIPSTSSHKVTAQDFYVWEELPAGQHVFSVQLVNNDNTPLDPSVTATIVITLPPQV